MTDDTTRRATATEDASSENRPTRDARGDVRDANGNQSGVDSPTEANDPVAGSDADTNSAKARFWLTNDVLAFLLVCSFVGVFVGAGMGLLDLASVPVEMRLAYLTISGGSAVWTFGQPAYQTWAKARSGGGASTQSSHCYCCSKRR